MDNLLGGWKDTLQSRSDLACLHENKQLTICLEDNEKRYFIRFDFGVVFLEESCQHEPDITVKTSRETLIKLIQGKERLSLIPDELIFTSGRYKDVLLLESLLYLGVS